MNTPRSLPPSAPARGSFPLDHAGACKVAAVAYLSCIRAAAAAPAAPECKALSRDYLACRMSHNLMAAENLDELGFGADSAAAAASADASAAAAAAAAAAAPRVRERVAGLSSAKRAKGVAFGLALPGGPETGAGQPARRGGGH